MLVAEYSYEEDIKVKQEEAKQEGISQGLSQGIERMIVNALTTTGSIKQTASILRLDEETVRRIAETNGIVEEL